MGRREKQAACISFRNNVFVLQGGLSGQVIELGLPLTAAGVWLPPFLQEAPCTTGHCWGMGRFYSITHQALAKYQYIQGGKLRHRGKSLMLRQPQVSRPQFLAMQEIAVFQSPYKLEEGKSGGEPQKWKLQSPPSFHRQLLHIPTYVRLPNSFSNVPVIEKSLKT